ncbi:MFS transporter [Salmonella enterica]|nr:MFS transporter [Salmonella enterica subsp. enterica serovar Afula]EJX6612290.1 MFS transporter [Salmonella enterica]
MSQPDSRLLLFAILLAVFVVPGSISGTAIALPFISADMNASLSALQWVVNAFNLTFACFTLFWGTLADACGRKKAFLSGTTIYAVASVMSALSPGALYLDISRALAGIGGAAIFSCGSAILIARFEGSQRTKAFALFGTTAGIGITFGPTISGFILDFIHWRAIFAVHAITLAVVLILAKSIPGDTATNRQFRFDIAGTVLFITALLLFMLAMVQGAQWGWTDIRTLSLLILAAVITVGFYLYENRIDNPMLNFNLLKNRTFVGLILIPVVASVIFVTLLTYYPSYLTGVMQLTPSKAGLMMIALTLPVLFCPVIAGRLVSGGASARMILFISLAAFIAGGITLILFSQPDRELWILTIPLLLIGTGMGLSAGLVDGLALSCVDPLQAGMAAGLLNTLRLGSEALAVALYASLLTSHLTGSLPGLFMQFSLPANQLTEWINAVASGNLTAPLKHAPGGNLLALIITQYHAAFIYVVDILNIITVALSLWILRLLMNKRAMTRQQVKE